MYFAHVAKKSTLDKLYQCQKCDFYCNKSSVYLKHLGTSHCVDETISYQSQLQSKFKILKCQTCDFACDKTPDFLNHLSTEHCLDDRQQIYKCQLCDFRFNKTLDYMQHLTSEHNIDSNVVKENMKTRSKKLRGLMYKCQNCMFVCKNKYKYLTHISERHNELIREGCSEGIFERNVGLMPVMSPHIFKKE